MPELKHDRRSGLNSRAAAPLRGTRDGIGEGKSLKTLVSLTGLASMPSASGEVGGEGGSASFTTLRRRLCKLPAWRAVPPAT